VTGLPTNARDIHATLSYKNLGGPWVSSNFVYTAHTSGGGGTNPPPLNLKTVKWLHASMAIELVNSL